MSEEVETYIVSDLARKISVERATKTKMPKVGIARYESGEADSDPLMQSYAKFERLVSEGYEQKLKALQEELDKSKITIREMNTKITYVVGRLFQIIERTKKSFFGKNEDIRFLANDAIIFTQNGSE